VTHEHTGERNRHRPSSTQPKSSTQSIVQPISEGTRLWQTGAISWLPRSVKTTGQMSADGDKKLIYPQKKNKSCQLRSSRSATYTGDSTPVCPLSSRAIARQAPTARRCLPASGCSWFCQQCFRFAQEALRFGILRPARILHSLPQALELGLGFLGVAKLLVRHGKKGDVGRD